MIRIKWDRINGIALPEGRVWPMVDQIIQDFRSQGRVDISVGSDTIINCFRVKVREGCLASTDVEIWMPLADGIEHQLKIDKNGRLASWPQGFCDLNDSLLLRLLSPASNEAGHG